jgi:ATP-binding cassette subfamily F protein uup
LPTQAEPLPNHAELTRPKKQKLSYREQRELDGLPAHIEALEARHTALLAAISEKDFYEQAQEHISEALTAVTESERALDAALERLIELEG